MLQGNRKSPSYPLPLFLLHPLHSSLATTPSGVKLEGEMRGASLNLASSPPVCIYQMHRAQSSEMRPSLGALLSHPVHTHTSTMYSVS